MNQPFHVSRGIMLLELLLAALLMITFIAAAMPALVTSFKRLDYPTAPGRLSITLESLREVLFDARLVIAPRAPRGARRGDRLSWIDGTGRVNHVFVRAGELIHERSGCSAESTLPRTLGPCDAALFHDRGHTRRIMRVRLVLDGFLLMTSIRILLPPEPLSLSEQPFLWLGPTAVETPSDARWFR